MHKQKNLINKIKPLTRLQELRIKRLEKVYQEKRHAYANAMDIVEQRQVSIENLKTRRSNAFQYLSQDDVMTNSACHTRADTHRYWLEYDLEKDEYYLPAEQQRMEEAQIAMMQAQKEWLRARSRKDGLEKHTTKLKKEVLKLKENRQELEAEEAFSH